MSPRAKTGDYGDGQLDLQTMHLPPAFNPRPHAASDENAPPLTPQPIPPLRYLHQERLTLHLVRRIRACQRPTPLHKTRVGVCRILDTLKPAQPTPGFPRTGLRWWGGAGSGGLEKTEERQCSSGFAVMPTALAADRKNCRRECFPRCHLPE